MLSVRIQAITRPIYTKRDDKQCASLAEETADQAHPKALFKNTQIVFTSMDNVFVNWKEFVHKTETNLPKVRKKLN